MTILLAFYFIINLYQAEKGKLKDYLLCGLGIGLAFGAHVVGIFIYASFLVVHYLKNRSQKIKQIIFSKYFWQANFAFTIVYFIVYYLNTYGFTRYLGGILPNLNKMLSLAGTFNFIADRPELTAQAEASRTIIGMLLYYLNALWQNEPLILLLAIFGTVALFIKKQKDVLLIIYSFIIIYCLAISSISIRTARYLLPIIPFMALMAAYGLVWLYDRIKYKKIIGGLIAVLCLLSLYPPLLWDYKFLLPSSRLEAVNWMYNNLPAGESIINFDGGLELNENRQSLLDIQKYTIFLTKKRAYLLNSSDEVFPKPNYYVFFYPHYEQIPPEIINKKFNYLIISWFNKENHEYRRSQLKKVNLDMEDLVLIKRFPAEATADDIGMDLGGSIDKPLVNLPRLKQNGPIVDIYKIK
jgi:hypothetical protein